MPIIEISVKNKVAASPTAQIVCGNSDYQIKFAFDDEWAAYGVKTARFSYGGKFVDVVFEGDICNAPVISGATVCAVGVFAGDLHTTTPALISCAKSILCNEGAPADPAPDVYAQIMELLNKIVSGGGEIDPAYVGVLVEQYLAENPPAAGEDGFSPTIKVDEKSGGYSVAVTDVYGRQTFFIPNGVDGSNGIDGYTPQKGVDYYTEADKAEMVDAVIAALPVYNGEVVDV